jgi:hypothetical protein
MYMAQWSTRKKESVKEDGMKEIENFLLKENSEKLLEINLECAEAFLHNKTHSSIPCFFVPSSEHIDEDINFIFSRKKTKKILLLLFFTLVRMEIIQLIFLFFNFFLHFLLKWRRNFFLFSNFIFHHFAFVLFIQ